MLIEYVSCISSENVQKHIMNNETTVLDFDFYGGAQIKSWKFSPDAFVQMAFQLAHYRCYNYIAPTYESASTKQFFHGRTETTRSVSNESIQFVMSMLNQNLKVRIEVRKNQRKFFIIEL